jgi:hypothetical protein
MGLKSLLLLIEGARELLATQEPDGCWKKNSTLEGPDCATCFAVLFLRRATAPLIKTGEKKP